MYMLGDAEVQSWPFAVWSGAVSSRAHDSTVIVFGRWSALDISRV
jgi:hypothetical protein